MNYKYAVIDIETTGTLFQRDKIIEIAIIILENDVEIKRYSSLVNPERSIPLEITRITGISNQMVESAPHFFEIAKEIIELTEDCIFVAHNVHFDYGFIQNEFEQLGYKFQRKKLCTLQLSKRNFKGLHSYSLGNLIQYFNIDVENRHRALDDAYASSILLKKILDIKIDYSTNEPAIKSLLKDIKFPPNVEISVIENLPEKCGVYFMRNQDGVPVYIGKSKNIYSRIQQHFMQSDAKSNKMQNLVFDIDYELTGSELMASILESKYIKEYSPEINIAQRNKRESICLYYSMNSNGIFQLKQEHIDEFKADQEQIIRFTSSKNNAKSMISFLIEKYQLCNSVNQAKNNNYKICPERLNLHCHGICENIESTEDYNERFLNMIAENNTLFTKNFILIDKGRNPEEKSCVIVKDGFCRGIGYLNEAQSLRNIEEIEEILEVFKPSVVSNSIIRNHLKNNPKTKCYYFSSEN